MRLCRGERSLEIPAPLSNKLCPVHFPASAPSKQIIHGHFLHGRQRRDRVATGTQTTNPNEAGTASAVDSDTEFELIGGPGTPLPEDLIVEKDVPTPDGPVTGYTPISSTYDSDDDGFLTGADLVTALRAEYPKYSWPPDYQLDLDAFIVVINEEVEKYNTLYENGMERSMLTKEQTFVPGSSIFAMPCIPAMKSA